MRILAHILFASCLLCSLAAQAAANGRALKPAASDAKRVALVIGNDHYEGVPPLQNAVADARSMAAALERAGFAVTLKTDANLPSMKQAMRNFKAKLSGGDEAVFFYSGHGVQLGAANYLLPVDIISDNEEQVKDDSIPLQRLLDDLQDQKVKFALAIIDACRNNPFKGKGRSIGGTRGLAATSAANGQMIIFSAGNGQQALDRLGDTDKHANGVFTRALIEEMQKPGIEVHQVLRSVRSRVVAMAKSVNHDQMPALYDQVEGDFLFYPEQIAPSVNNVPIPMHSNVQAKSKENIEDEHWDAIKDSSDHSLFQQYRQSYPSGRYLAMADMRIIQLKKNMVVVPSLEAEAQRVNGEPEMVRIPGKNYEMGKYEVSQKEWREVMGSNPSKFSACGNNCPVEQVSWDDIQIFLQKLNAKTGKQYRLPDEAEWEYACYGGNKTEYCGSNDINSVAWYGGSRATPPMGNSGSETHPVGQKQANGYGLYDMSGNVFEWMNNCYDSSNCSAGRALRGGSWYATSLVVSAANRYGYGAAIRLSRIGFRVARTLP